jgi:DNA (cytosine-5)-methyltransferase 1
MTQTNNLIGRRKPSVLSLFSGCGGMDLGVELAGGKTVWSNEYNKWACETYRSYFPHVKMVEGPIENVDLDTELPKKGAIDIVVGGFPCQDFSMIWKRPGLKGTRGNLYTYFVDIVSRLQPLAFIAENVKGLISANGGLAIQQIEKDFASCGYHLTTKVYNFAEYGAPQLRQRVLIIGLRDDTQRSFVPPPPSHAPREDAKRLGLKPFIGAAEALKGVEKVALNNDHQKIMPKTKKLLELIPPGGNFTSIPKDHPLYVKGMISHVYRRLHPDLPSTTIIAGGGGGTWGYHYSEPRALTNRERARLFGFPDDMEFSGSITEVRRQIGNAVPPVGIRPIAEQLINTLKGI